MDNATSRSGARILVDQLIVQGVERLTCVPGESYLAVLDALHSTDIDTLVCRHEGGAAMMAEAYGKLTGRPGICFVTRGPGATNASHGIHIAAQDSTPMILFIGQIERGMREREAFQELNYKAVFGTMAKWVVEIDDPARVPELIARAFRVACQGRPGPVVVALPEDMLTEQADVADAPRIEVARSAPDPEDLVRLASLLAGSKRPVVILGGSRWSEASCAGMVAFAERFELPVATSFRRSSLFPADHPNYAGDVGIAPDPRLAARIREADLLLLVGGRFSEMPSSSYSLMRIPRPRQTLVHVYPDPQELGRVYQPDLAIEASPDGFVSGLKGLVAPSFVAWRQTTREANRDYRDWSDNPMTLPGAFQYGAVVCWLRERLPADAIVTHGAGNYSGWIHRHYRFRHFNTQIAPTSGSMGYGVPAAIMAKRQHPDRTVVSIAGDGCFLMNGQEFATAVQYHIAVVIVVIDNSMFGTIRMHQERAFPGRVFATDLRNPDFAGYATVFGGHGELVERTEDFAAAFERALSSGKPSIIHCKLDPEAITGSQTLTDIRQQALDGAH